MSRRRRPYPDAPLQMLVTNQEYSDYVGRIAIGRVFAGQFSEGQNVTVIDTARRSYPAKDYADPSVSGP